MSIRWPWLLSRGLAALIAALLVLDIGLAWIYVGALIYPGCNLSPPPITDHPPPEEIQLHPEEGLTLRGWYYPSQNGAAVIALGGLGGSLGSQLPPVGALLDAGYGVLQVDSRACATPPAPVTLGYREAQDAAAGLAFLRSRAEVNAEHIGVFGFSMGGVAAIRAAARHPEIAAVLAEGGYYNLGDDLVDKGSPQPLLRRVLLYTVAAVFWLRSGVNPWESSPLDDLPRIAPRPVFLIFGEYEADSGRAQLQFETAGEPKSLWVVPGGFHGGNHLTAPEEYNRRVVGFFNRSLVRP